MSDPKPPKVPLVEEEDDSEPVDETELPDEEGVVPPAPAPEEEEEDLEPAATAPPEESSPSSSGELGFGDYVPILAILMVIGSLTGLVLYRGQNLSNKAQRAVNSPFIYGIILMLHGVYGSKGITTPPMLLKALFDRPGMKVFTLYLLAFAATRDLEDALFAAVLFLGLTQLLRTPTERNQHPGLL